jgi:hypothetical protein
MSLNIKQTDTNTLQLVDGAASTASTATLQEVVTFGRGATDLDITYLALRNASGTQVYIYPNSGGTGVTVSTTAP